jgi:cell division septum initiation protein DivIVA
MSNIKNWEKFNEYSSFDHSKDEIRINSMVDKAKDEDHLLRLAQTMANRIKKAEKAYHRAEAAEDQNYHAVAKIFYDRAEELGY